MKIVIFGGNGFIGRHLAAALAARGHHLILPVRDREKAKALIILPATDVIAFDPIAMYAILPCLQNADAVVNLVGILNERERGDFVRVHGEFVRILTDGCTNKKVSRFVQLSALNAISSAPSEYLRSKAKAEQIVRNASALRHVIIRPSVVFGAGDSFVNLFVTMARRLPLLPLPCAEAQLQPLAVGDLVAMLVRALETGDEDNKILSAGGPETITLAGIVSRALNAAGVSRPLIKLNPPLSYCAAAVAEIIPGLHFLSRDNCLSANLPSFTPADNNDAQRMLGELTPLDTALAAMFEQRRGGMYSGLRAHSRR